METNDENNFDSKVYMSTGTNNFHLHMIKKARVGLDVSQMINLYCNIVQISELVYDEISKFFISFARNISRFVRWITCTFTL